MKKGCVLLIKKPADFPGRSKKVARAKEIYFFLCFSFII